MPETNVFTAKELLRLSREASGPHGGLEVLNEAQKLGDKQFEGVARSFALRPGLSMLYTELTAKQTFEMDGEIDTSLNIAVMSGSGAMSVSFSSGDRHKVGSNQAIVISVKDKATLYGKYKAGQKNRVLRLRLFPDEIEDQDLALVVQSYCSKSQIVRFPFYSETSSMLPLIREPIGGSLAGRLAAESIAFDLIARLVIADDISNQPSAFSLMANERNKLLRVRDQIISDPSVDYRLEQLAATAGMGVSSLKEKFPLLFGRPVIAFLRDVRLDAAREAIECGKMSVTQASRLAGYKHASTFSAAFRKRFGAPPSEFLKKRLTP
ncbi:MAG: AraC family transcriptional regulator [Pseudomonadota bacterium]